jgi:sulfur carrier protein ThiS
MENYVNVVLELAGNYAKLLNGKRTQIKVNTKLSVAIKEIQEHLRAYGISDSGYILMLGAMNVGSHSKETEKIGLVEGDRFRVIPFISGG